MSIAMFDDESQDLDDFQMNSSEYAAESNIDPEGSSSSFRDMISTDNPPLPTNKYLIITKDPIILTRARIILYPKVYTYLMCMYLFMFRRRMILQN
jgi:hypothetical protein